MAGTLGFNVTLHIATQMVEFQFGGRPMKMPFAQFGEFLLNGAPGGGSVLSWTKLSDSKRVGVSSAGLLRVQQGFDPTKVQLPVLDMARYDYLRDSNRAKNAWQLLKDKGVIITQPRKATDQHQVVIRGIVPARTWEVEYAMDGLIRETLIRDGNWANESDPDLGQWPLGNANETGGICWGDNPPVWNPATTIEDIDFFFLTGAAFNTDWQPAEFQWAEPHRWNVQDGLVIFGSLGHVEGWTWAEKPTLANVTAKLPKQPKVEATSPTGGAAPVADPDDMMVDLGGGVMVHRNTLRM